MPRIRPAVIAVTLADCVRKNADPPEIAADLAATLQDVESTLSSVIGARGVAALYKRALLLAASGHPWLSGVPSEWGTPEAQTTLQTVISRQPPEQAASGAHTILHNFQSLLQALVGAPLTTRLLQPALTHYSQRATAHDRRP